MPNHDHFCGGRTPRITLYDKISIMSDFSLVVKKVVRNIPKGTVMTYKEVAVAAGNKKAARAVANVMAKNYDLDIPCHRVIRTDGGLGGYNRGGETVKKQILEKEGVVL